MSDTFSHKDMLQASQRRQGCRMPVWPWQKQLLRDIRFWPWDCRVVLTLPPRPGQQFQCNNAWSYQMWHGHQIHQFGWVSEGDPILHHQLHHKDGPENSCRICRLRARSKKTWWIWPKCWQSNIESQVDAAKMCVCNDLALRIFCAASSCMLGQWRRSLH